MDSLISRPVGPDSLLGLGVGSDESVTWPTPGFFLFSLCINGMVKTTTDWSITIRLGVVTSRYVPLAPLETFMSEFFSHYVLGYEEPHGAESGHWQIAAISIFKHRQSDWQDKIRRFVKETSKTNGFEWEEKHEKVAVKVKYHPDVLTLAGGYCQKQDLMPPYKGWSESELKRGKEDYAEILETKKKQLPVTALSLTSLLRQYYQECVLYITAMDTTAELRWSRLTASDKFQFLERKIIADGYDISLACSPYRRNYYIKHFSEFFEGGVVPDF